MRGCFLNFEVVRASKVIYILLVDEFIILSDFQQFRDDIFHLKFNNLLDDFLTNMLLFNGLANQKVGQLLIILANPVRPKCLQPIPILNIILGHEWPMRIIIIALDEFFEPMDIIGLEGLHRWVALEVGEQVVLLELQQH